MPKAVQMQLQMPFLRSTAAADLFLGPIKIEVLVKISQSNCQKFFFIDFSDDDHFTFVFLIST